jgi:hypothetical protein
MKKNGSFITRKWFSSRKRGGQWKKKTKFLSIVTFCILWKTVPYWKILSLCWLHTSASSLTIKSRVVIPNVKSIKRGRRFHWTPFSTLLHNVLLQHWSRRNHLHSIACFTTRTQFASPKKFFFWKFDAFKSWIRSFLSQEIILPLNCSLDRSDTCVLRLNSHELIRMNVAQE